jgi:hypothetical protein
MMPNSGMPALTAALIRQYPVNPIEFAQFPAVVIFTE